MSRNTVIIIAVVAALLVEGYIYYGAKIGAMNLAGQNSTQSVTEKTNDAVDKLATDEKPKERVDDELESEEDSEPLDESDTEDSTEADFDQMPTEESSTQEPAIVAPLTTEEVALCLKEKGAVFYGAFWCPHCQEQKKLFGESMKHITYVECDPEGKNAQPEKCDKVGVEAYPTWVIPGKEKLTGTQGVQKLAAIAGCSN